MRALGRALVLAALAIVVGGAGAPPPADPVPSAIVVTGVAGAAHRVNESTLAALPRVRVTTSFGHAGRPAAFAGPLLWRVLARAGVVDAAVPRGQVRQVVLVTGADGYGAVLALGEISPAFEGKQVILADRMNGKPIAPDHWRIVVPGDRHGARSVRDVVRIALVAVDAPKP